MTNLCENCKYYNHNTFRCQHEKSEDGISLIDGSPVYRSAYYMRLTDNRCGKDGLLFEERNIILDRMAAIFFATVFIFIPCLFVFYLIYTN